MIATVLLFTILIYDLTFKIYALESCKSLIKSSILAINLIVYYLKFILYWDRYSNLHNSFCTQNPLRLFILFIRYI